MARKTRKAPKARPLEQDQGELFFGVKGFRDLDPQTRAQIHFYLQLYDDLPVAPDVGSLAFALSEARRILDSPTLVGVLEQRAVERARALGFRCPPRRSCADALVLSQEPRVVREPNAGEPEEVDFAGYAVVGVLGRKIHDGPYATPSEAEAKARERLHAGLPGCATSPVCRDARGRLRLCWRGPRGWQAQVDVRPAQRRRRLGEAAPNPSPRIPVRPDEEAKKFVRWALEARAAAPDSKKCCTPAGIRRGASILMGQQQDAQDIRAWSRRHRGYYEAAAARARAAGRSLREAAPREPAIQAWWYWGGDPMIRDAEAVLARHERKRAANPRLKASLL